MNRLARWLVAVGVVPLLILAALRVWPALDKRWEQHPAHFWLVLIAAALATGLGYSVFSAARRRRDARLALVSLAFVASAGFLGLHALATPGVLLEKNAGFELATPVGLLIGSAFVVASALEPGPARAMQILRLSRPLLLALFAAFAVWAAVSLAELPPLDSPLPQEELNGWQIVLGGSGVALYAVGAAGYARLYQRRGARLVLLVAMGFLLLADALLVVAWAQNWQVSWWEWHVLMLASFGLIAYAAHREWHEERFSALYLEETLAGVRDASVMFADLMGFTPYSEQRSPTEVAAMLNAYFGRLVPLLEERGGEVHQLIGDAVMVVFNKQGDQPDHALLAARAALDFQREAAQIAAEHSDWPRFRVGVNSGEVLAGVVGAGTGHRKHGLVGDTVNLGARLESEAPAGEVVVGAGTYERLPPGALVERLPPLDVKGKREPVEAYLLHGLREEVR
ncbi:MAG TPA: adenylate/guanylate cyclase domain-containing protein [Gaiellaceae bacterium]|nr:adenylate/guanylate cyclase domain-containing protein [Gaiellaceae bacterium]